MQRKQYNGECKARIAMEEIPRIFSIKKLHDARKEEELRASLYQQIGQLQVEVDWLKKKLDLTVEERRGLVEGGMRRSG